ncbi:hypothetical protein HZA44_03485 [Candidatus Peregrinibacteria bacterium]|nr:hypothetical protein [Candidatus Peregrinibacteria bacterium]
MKNPTRLEDPSRTQNHPLPALLRAAVASVLLATLPAEASGPQEKEMTTVAVMGIQRKISLAQPKTDPFEEALKTIGQTKDEAQIRKLWLNLARTQPAKVLEYSELIYSPFMMETLKEACEVSAIKFPELFLERAFDCTDVPQYQELVLKAAKNAARAKPEAAIEYQERYATFPGGQEIVEKAMENVRRKTAKLTQKTAPASMATKGVLK